MYTSVTPPVEVAVEVAADVDIEVTGVLEVEVGVTDNRLDCVRLRLILPADIVVDLYLLPPLALLPLLVVVVGMLLRGDPGPVPEPTPDP